MRFFLLVILLLIFIYACEKDRVEQIKVTIPEGIIIPDDMAYIPSGNFIMGHSDYPDTKKGKIINQEAFLIDRFEVSREQFSNFKRDYRFHPKKSKLQGLLLNRQKNIANGMVGDFRLKRNGKNRHVVLTEESGLGKNTTNIRIMGFLDLFPRL